MKTLKKNNEFRLIYNIGNKIYGFYVIVFLRKNKMQENRFGFVASKKIGNAVCRNRIKRLFKEYCRVNELRFILGFDIVLVAKQKAGKKFKELKYKEIEQDLEKCFENYRLFKKQS